MNPVIPDTPFTASRFAYDDFRINAAANQLICTYRLDEWEFTETVALPNGGDWSQPAVRQAARLVFLLAGVSYYKAGAPPVIDLGRHAVTDTEVRHEPAPEPADGEALVHSMFEPGRRLTSIASGPRPLRTSRLALSGP